MNSQKKIFPVGALIAGVFLLFNPNASLIDILPDCIAYALFLYALRHVATFVPYMQEASDGFRRLFYLSLIKLPALIVMLMLASQRVTITLFSFTFAVLELIFLFPAITNFFEGLFYMGQRFGCRAAIADERYHGGVSAVRTTTYAFFIVKMVLSTLPDFLLLFEYDPLSGSGFTVPMTQYAFVVGLACLLALAVGIVWLIYLLPYLGAIKEELDTLDVAPPDEQDPKSRESRRLRLSIPFFLFALGSCLTVDFVASNRSLLPDYLSAAAFLALAILLYLQKKKEVLPALITSGGYLVLSVLYSVFRRSFYARFTESDLSMNAEAAYAYAPALALSLLSEVAFVAVFILLGKALYRFYKENELLEAPKNEYEAHLLQEEAATREKQNRLLLLIAVLTATASFLSNLLAYFKEPSEVNAWQRFFLPLFTSFWILPLVLSLLCGIAVSVILRGRTKDLYRMWAIEKKSSIE